MWKIITIQIREEIHDSLTIERNRKDAAKDPKAQESYSTLIKASVRRKNLAMAWIDYKKAYDIVSQSWIINCLKCTKYQTKS